MRITGGFLKNQTLITPKVKTTRPTSEKLRQTVFNIAQHHVADAHFLDLYAGSGAMGIEALSRGAKEAVFIEKERAALAAIRENLKDLDLEPLATVLQGDVLSLLKKLKGKSFELIYIDPPYAQGLQMKTLSLIDELDLLHPQGLLFIEEAIQGEVIPPVLNNLELKKKRKVSSTFLLEIVHRSTLAT